MIIDDVKITIRAGRGGNGMAAFNKTKMSLGPTGGSGGKGGNVFVKGISNLNALNKFRFKKEFRAEDGKNGMQQLHDGRNGEDLILYVPVGTVVRKLNPRKDIEITKIGQSEILAQGGEGGRGNYHFRSATNTSPKEFEEGEIGESFDLSLELKLIADVGFVGLPNVGKSSLLNELTNAKSKVANYPFTTLEPNLGVYYDLILADIPGLVEGAAGGKGLGIKFLRHIERTKILFHFIAADSSDPALDYQTVREELGAYNKMLLEKSEYIFISKSDAVQSEDLKIKITTLKKINPLVSAISIYDDTSLNTVKSILNKIKAEKLQH